MDLVSPLLWFFSGSAASACLVGMDPYPQWCAEALRFVALATATRIQSTAKEYVIGLILESFGTDDITANIKSLWWFFEATTSKRDEIMDGQGYPLFSSLIELLEEKPTSMNIQSAAI